MKRPQDMPDLFALSQAAHAELTEPVRMPRTSTASSIHISRSIHSSGYDRKVLDFYATPDWVTEALLRNVQFRGRVWEPCSGTGAITTVLQRHGYDVTSPDIADHGFGTPGVDFLSCQAVPEGCRALVTNPPYGTDTPSRKSQEKSAMAMLRFVDHALRLAGSVQGQLALLVRFQWGAGKRAAALMSAGPFAAVIALTRRIQWFDRGEATNISQHHHAWVVFDHAHPTGQPPTLLFADQASGGQFGEVRGHRAIKTAGAERRDPPAAS
jgi:hypothetical protein